VSFAARRLIDGVPASAKDTVFPSSIVRRCCLIAAVDVEKYRQRLLTLEREFVRKLAREVEAARASAEDQSEPGDQSVADELREAYFTLAQSDSQLLANVRAALRRIEDGTYGRCVVDGGPIEEERLAAVPWTAFCARHKQEVERPVRTPRL
jgi:DnaK suppressor protein